MKFGSNKPYTKWIVLIIIFFEAGAEEMKGDEFWDYDQQIDLESFDSQKLYKILSDQARKATKELGRQKEEVTDGFHSLIVHLSP